MSDRCADCKFFDQDQTELPVCLKHRRFMSGEWTCNDFKPRVERKDRDASS